MGKSWDGRFTSVHGDCEVVMTVTAAPGNSQSTHDVVLEQGESTAIGFRLCDAQGNPNPRAFQRIPTPRQPDLIAQVRARAVTLRTPHDVLALRVAPHALATRETDPGPPAHSVCPHPQVSRLETSGIVSSDGCPVSSLGHFRLGSNVYSYSIQIRRHGQEM